MNFQDFKEEKPKPRKVTITFDEYKAIRHGLDEIIGTMGYGDLSDEQLKEYKNTEKLLEKLLYKIINS